MWGQSAVTDGKNPHKIDEETGHPSFRLYPNQMVFWGKSKPKRKARNRDNPAMCLELGKNEKPNRAKKSYSYEQH